MKNIFDQAVTDELTARVEALNPDSQPLWGKMSVDQMLAHCSVAYEMAYTDKHPKPNGLMRFLLKTFVKSGVVNEKPYPKNARTAPVFIISDRRDFEKEKSRLIGYLQKTQELGSEHFEGKESPSFGAMTAQEWNNLFYKHLDHHLNQFGV
ncbi:DUF1569 domain-containing protein [uncultured Algoriphagus sp.]|uniref:DUF1569 domain-containing protein n=1 Tax=uncultured Algoriphagus sp. TaxID=417365 RepID=UPI0025835756|nr:DUF1569 domain-containing protein [uncultured Algoriphagus sp.]